MGRKVGILSARGVANASKPGYHADGGNLYLQITESGAKSWIFRYKLPGGKMKHPREMGLGPLHTVSLARAREDAQRYRLMLRDGLDPIEQRKVDRTVKAGIPTFWEAAQSYIEEHKAGWKNAKHSAQWESTLKAYAKPTIGDKTVSDVTTDDVLKILQPIWAAKTETATRVRQRVEVVLDAAKAKGQLQGDNPARWKGHLDKLLPKSSAVHTVKHFPALPYAQLPGFMKKLAKQTATAARALEFLILTAARTNMVTKAERREIGCTKEAGDLWTVPASRMKAKRVHVIPLAKQAKSVLDGLPVDGEPIFAGDIKPYLSNGAMDALLERMEYSHITVHGFRSTFKDWCSETTSFANEISEAALAHTIKDKTEAAYRRGNLLMKRKELMQAWADYCVPSKGKATKAA